MKKILLSLISLVTLAFSSQTGIKAKVVTDKLTKKFLAKNIPIVDIRTAPEWKETGVIKNSILLTFFKKDGSYDVREFFQGLNDNKITKKTTFALLCRTGSRTTMVSKFLKSQGYENVINLKGGIYFGLKNNINLVKIK